MREQMTTAAQAMAGMQFASAESDTKTNFDESVVGRAETLNCAYSSN